MSERSVRTTLAASALFVGLGVAAPALAEGNWDNIRQALFGDRPIAQDTDLVRLEAPKRAHDAALVPVTVEAAEPQTDDAYIKTLYLIIDENPAPIAATVHLTPKAGLASIATRVRVNEYTPMRVVAETDDGSLHMVEAFVKASGGCSAPAMKDRDKAMARLGKMKLSTVGDVRPGEPTEALLMVSHPNNTGMQIDQLTRYWIPPDFVKEITIGYGGQEILRAETDISISEDPNFRFHFLPEGPGELTAKVVDTEGRTFEQSLPVEMSPAT